jgi:hypothetical protein
MLHREGVAAGLPLGHRFLQPEVMQAPVVWLASEASSAVNAGGLLPITGMKASP